LGADASRFAAGRRTAVFLGAALLVVAPAWAAYPLIGLDYVYFLPRLLDTFLYQARNGFGIHWWTPTFGGGLPVFPNPQDLQFSLPQLFTWLFDPFVAVVATTVVMVLASAWALHRLACRVLGWEEAAACLFAVVASTGGFVTTRMAVGHVSYHAIFLTPVLLLLAMDRSISRRLAIPLVGVVAAYFIYSGGYFVSFAAPLTLLIALPLVRLLGPRSRTLREAIVVLGAGAVVSLLLCIARLYAVASYMSSFPRLQVAEPLPSVFSPLVQVVASPILTLGSEAPAPLDFHRALFQQSWGIWETDASIAWPVAFLGFAAIPWAAYLRARDGNRAQRGLVLMALGAFAFVVVLAAAKGPLFEGIKALPGFSNFRVTARFAGCLGLPLALLGVAAWRAILSGDRFSAKRAHALWALVVFALAQQAAYTPLMARAPAQTGAAFDAGGFLAESARLQSEPSLDRPIERLAYITDPEAATARTSSLLVYEALIGAFIQGYRPFLSRTALVPGAADEVRDGFFNMHYPPAFGYARQLGLPAYRRVPVDDRENLERFLAGQPTQWPIPPAQRVLGGITLAALALTLGWLLALVHPRFRPPASETGCDGDADEAPPRDAPR